MQFTTSSAAFLIATCAYLGIRTYFKRKVSDATGVVSKSSRGDMALVGLVVAGQIFLPLLALFSPLLDWAQYRSLTPALLWPGALLMVAGVWLFWRSHADLGDNWSVTLEVQEDHRLISNGVYRTIRHPMYASFFLMAVGQLLLLPNWIAGPSALAAVALLYFVRKPNEEAMLLEQFGEDYRRYMNSTGGILPKFGASDA
jgi:protein-S-isoprenylcysteine O-methyltransferase Ste14